MLGKKQNWFLNPNEHSRGHSSSVTRLGNLLDFGQLFKAFGNSEFVQISDILRQFL